MSLTGIEVQALRSGVYTHIRPVSTTICATLLRQLAATANAKRGLSKLKK
jgi:hypothetical protein